MDWLSKHLKLLKDSEKFQFKNQLDENAADFLSKIGIEEGQTILDFGCGSGTYAIPAAKLVGEDGSVYALDVKGGALDELEETAESEGPNNIMRMDSHEGERIPLKEDELDWALLIDVLHEVEEKDKLLDEISRVLKPSGSVCIYPMHIEEEKVEDMARESGFEIMKKLFEGRILLFEPKSSN